LFRPFNLELPYLEESLANLIRTLDLRGKHLSAPEIRQIAPRASLDIAEAAKQVQPLLADIQARGVEAVLAAARQFDGFEPSPIWVAQNEIDKALEDLQPALRTAIEEAIARVRKVSKDSMPSSSRTSLADGAEVSQRWAAVESVGLYVPGGRAVYPSSVIMNVVPAQVAGVTRLVIATPGQKEFDGRPHPTVLATAGLLGVSEILVIGGPAAIAAFAFGLEQIDLQPVDVVTGPGNIYVAAAKRLLRGQIGIDSEAGTTEILVLADQSADARLIAFDLISQAEHDDAAASILVTNSENLLASVSAELQKLAGATRHSERVLKALGGQQSALVLVDDLDAAIDFANAYATEHLEIMTADDDAVVGKIRHAGALFVGKYSPVSLGDYMAGSNHVLPTGSTARFSSGLGVATFLRPQQIIRYDESGLAPIADLIDSFAQAEGLPAHGEAVKARFSN
jgi:histidinol dehydrogenase